MTLAPSDSPDAAAASLDVPLRVVTAPGITEANIGAIVSTTGADSAVVTGTVVAADSELITVLPLGSDDDETNRRRYTADPERVFYVLREAPAPEQPEQIDIGLARELALVTDLLRRREAEVAELKARKAELSSKLLGAFELNGVRRMTVDDRSIYTHTKTYPRLRERPPEEGGGRYTNADVVAAFKAIGRENDVKPESVNYQTLGALLREYGKAKQPVPAALAKVVELVEDPEVRVGKGSA